MKALVIYDATGKIWSIFYGENQVPQGLLALFVDIPDGGQLERIDVTNPDDPKPVFTYLPESDIGKLQNRMLPPGPTCLTAKPAALIFLLSV